jgi:ankyrin repeat protein
MKAILGIFIISLALHCGAKGGNTNSVQYAVDSGNLDMVKRFFATNASLLTPKESAGLLTDAAVHGQIEMAAFFISKGADVNQKGFFGMPPLASMASVFKSPNDVQFADIAALLIAHGAEVDPVDEYHKTPLLYAVENENSHLADALLKNGACQTNRYGGVNFGMTPLHMAIQDKDTKMVRVLLKYNPPLDAVDGDGATPLLLAEELNQTEMVAMIHQADPQVALKTYITPPTKEAMRTLAQRIADGDEAAFEELSNVTVELYRGIKDPQKEHARIMLNLFRMTAAFDLLGDEAGKGNENAFQALKKSLGTNHLKSFAPDALGRAAAGGNKEALDILLHYEQWDILQSSALFALCIPAKANIEPAVDYFVTGLPNIEPYIVMDATNALASAAAKGNLKAQKALEKFTSTEAEN